MVTELGSSIVMTFANIDLVLRMIDDSVRF